MTSLLDTDEGLIEHALRARYGGPPVEPTLPEEQWHEILRQQLTHRSVRAFSDEEITEETLNSVLIAAQSAPTSSNLQPWSVVAVRDPGRRQRLAAHAGNQQAVREAAVFLVWVIDYSRLGRIAADHNRKVEGTDYLEASLVGAIDASLAAQNASLAAQALGLGSVFIGGIRNNPDRVIEELRLPERTFPVVGLALGHPDEERPARVKPRLPLSVVVHHETYRKDPAPEREQIAGYEERIGEFYASEQLAHSWIERVLERFADRASLKGRDRLRDQLRDQRLALE